MFAHYKRVFLLAASKLQFYPTDKVFTLKVHMLASSELLHPQNHVATNVVAILIGSLVVEQHNARARRWMARAVEMYERTMRFLALVDDGSLTEGVGYVGYTVRSLSQYVVLLRRHLGIDHTRHPWLRRHFDFYYYTTLPGLQVVFLYNALRNDSHCRHE